MADILLSVRQNTRPTITRVMRDFRNESNPNAVVNITGYALKLSVKRAITDADSDAVFDLSASIVTAASGTYRFTLTPEHTFLPTGVYPGEIRWWTDGTTTNPPHDALSVDFEIQTSVDQVV
jgi:hypothetical protein